MREARATFALLLAFATMGCPRLPEEASPTVVPIANAAGASTAPDAPPRGCDPDGGATPETVSSSCATALDVYCVPAPNGGFVSRICETLPEAIVKARASPWEATLATCSAGAVVRTDDGVVIESLFFDRCRKLVGIHTQMKQGTLFFCDKTSSDMLSGRSNVGDCRVTETIQSKVPR